VKSVTTPERGGVVVEMESGSIARGDALFYAVGRQANTDSLNLSATRVVSNKRGIVSVCYY
jgi:NAD(P) transhydrogenase